MLYIHINMSREIEKNVRFLMTPEEFLETIGVASKDFMAELPASQKSH